MDQRKMQLNVVRFKKYNVSWLWYRYFFIFSACVLLFVSNTCAACTNFRVRAEDGSIVVARSNEFFIPFRSSIVYTPAGVQCASNAPKGNKGLSWTSRYAFLGVNGFDIQDKFADGMNEEGLAIQGLMFADSEFEIVPPGQNANALGNSDFIPWVLGNFATVEEVRKALPHIFVWNDLIQDTALPLHYAIHDAKGDCIVVEFIKNEKQVHDNPVGVMTNMPDISWQLTHLRQYVHLDPITPFPKKFLGVSLQATGQGAGWLGIPGDWTPPSRFVRVAYLVYGSSPVKDAKKAVNLAKHIMNTVDIPFGSVSFREPGKNTINKEYTQWCLLKDLTNKILYYYSYEDLNLKAIDIAKLKARVGQAKTAVSINEEFFAIDATEKFTAYGK